MSYTPEPKWTDIIAIPDVVVCPDCKVKPENYSTVIDCILNHDYYHPQHIPPVLEFTCFNPECDRCDQDFRYKTRVTVNLEPAQ